MSFFYNGAPANFNLWGERRTSEYLLLKRGFGTCMRIVTAKWVSAVLLCFLLRHLMPLFYAKLAYLCKRIANSFADLRMSKKFCTFAA